MEESAAIMYCFWESIALPLEAKLIVISQKHKVISFFDFIFYQEKTDGQGREDASRDCLGKEKVWPSVLENIYWLNFSLRD